MSRDPDDDALRWEGDDDPTLSPGWKAVGAPSTAASGAEPVASGADEPVASGTDETADEPHAPDAAGQTGSVELVVLGVLGGVYLLYTIGWIITALRTSTPGTSIVGDFMYALGLWLAVLAAPCWFLLALRGTRGTRARLIWLIAGVVVLAPVPFILGVAV